MSVPGILNPHEMNEEMQDWSSNREIWILIFFNSTIFLTSFCKTNLHIS
jgi:hypothetical protein